MFICRISAFIPFKYKIIEMKNNLLACLVITILALASCNSASNKPQELQQMSKMDSLNNMPNNSNMHTATADLNDVKVTAVAFTDVDTKAALFVKEIIDHYLHIKNALTNDNGNEAANGAKAMEAVLRKFDKSFLSAEQKKIYDGIQEDMKEHSEHIGKNAANIKHQREHFSMMSEDVYDLVKAFGGGRAIYHDHCPMYNDNKGAIWLSETKEVKNPYFGEKMPTCGTVVEVFK
jgi:Protein of unknown function (DUF3347)